MTGLSTPAVKQCHADPALEWLRAVLAGVADAAMPTEAQQRSLIDEGLAPLIAARLGDACPSLLHDARQLAMRELAHQQALQRLAGACVAERLQVLVIKGE